MAPADAPFHCCARVKLLTAPHHCTSAVSQIHTHGGWFWVVAAGLAGDGDYKGQPLVPTLPRDTGTINAQSFAVLRFLVTNLGSWIVHCQ